MLLTVQLSPEVLVEKDCGTRPDEFLTRPHPLVTMPNLYFRVMITDAIPADHADPAIEHECEYLQKDLAQYIKGEEFGAHLRQQVKVAYAASRAGVIH